MKSGTVPDTTSRTGGDYSLLPKRPPLEAVSPGALEVTVLQSWIFSTLEKMDESLSQYKSDK